MNSTATRYNTTTLAVSIIFPFIIASAVLLIFVEGDLCYQIPCHSSVEAFGGFAAMTLGFIILILQKNKKSVSQGVWVSCGLLCMGVVDVFHASVQPGTLFVWLRSVSSLAGGFFFMLAWLQGSSDASRTSKGLPLGVFAGAIIFGILSVVFSGILPVMVSQGNFTQAAIAINIAGGIFFIAAAPRFFIGYWKRNNRDDLLFVFITVLFGISGFIFQLSKPWSLSWWYWHFLRLIAFVIVLVYTLIIYKRFILTIGDAVFAISSTATQIATTVEQHERTATQQSAMVNQTTVTMTELSSSFNQSKGQAENASERADNALAAAREGVRTSEDTLKVMLDLRGKVDAIAGQILLLSEHTGRIGSITKIVKDIANQTNLLALNAAVEAARAGEHGRGFAIISQEIRKLADQCKKSAEKINTLVGDTQKATNSTVMVTEEGTKAVEQGASLIQKNAESFSAVNTANRIVSENVKQIALTFAQQLAAARQVVDAMNVFNAGAKETAAGLRQTKVGIENLNEAAKNLKEMV